MAENVQVKISQCYQSFKRSGYVCGGCAEYHVCQMAKDNTATLAKLIKVLEGAK